MTVVSTKAQGNSPIVPAVTEGRTKDDVKAVVSTHRHKEVSNGEGQSLDIQSAEQQPGVF